MAYPSRDVDKDEVVTEIKASIDKRLSARAIPTQ